MSDRLRLGIVGAGWVVRTCYLSHIAADVTFEVTAVIDPIVERAEEVAAVLPGARVARAFTPEIAAICDAVLVATPSPNHRHDVFEALALGQHVLCEKPVASRAADARDLAKAARRAGRALMPACVCRHRVDAARWLAMVARLGAIDRVDLTWRRHRGVPATPWHLEPSDGMTGVLADLGYHLIDLAYPALAAAGPPVSVQVATGCRGVAAGADWYGVVDGACYQVADDIRAEVVLASGALIRLSVSWVDDSPGDVTLLRAVGARGEAVLQGLFGLSPHRRLPFQRCRLRLADGEEERADFIPGPALHLDAFGPLIETFRQACLGTRDDRAVSIEPVAAIMEIIAAAR